MNSISPCEFDNQRKHTRFVRDDIKVSIFPTSFLISKETSDSKLIDICSAGLQLSSKDKLKIKTKVTLILQFDNGHKFKIKAKIVRQQEKTHYLSDYQVDIKKTTLKNKKNPLKSVFLIESNKKIEAKYRFLNIKCIRVLTFTPLNPKKEYHVIFTLKDGTTIKKSSKPNKVQQFNLYSYGIKFEHVNDLLGDHLLDTQTDLVFK